MVAPGDAFQHYFWGDKNAGYDVLLTNMKQGVTATKEFHEILRERANYEETFSKSLRRLSEKASAINAVGAFLPVWTVLKKYVENMSKIHGDFSAKFKELCHELSNFKTETTSKTNKLTKESNGIVKTAAALSNIKASLDHVNKCKKLYHQKHKDVIDSEESLTKAGVTADKSDKEQEKIQQKFIKSQEAFTLAENTYKASVEKYNKAQEEYNEDMTNSCKFFGEIEQTHLNQMVEFAKRFGDIETDLIEELKKNCETILGGDNDEGVKGLVGYTPEHLIEIFVDEKTTGVEMCPLMEVELLTVKDPPVLSTTPKPILEKSSDSGSVNSIPNSHNSATISVPPNMNSMTLAMSNVNVSMKAFRKMIKKTKKSKNKNEPDSKSIDSKNDHDDHENGGDDVSEKSTSEHDSGGHRSEQDFYERHATAAAAYFSSDDDEAQGDDDSDEDGLTAKVRTIKIRNTDDTAVSTELATEEELRKATEKLTLSCLSPNTYHRDRSKTHNPQLFSGHTSSFRARSRPRASSETTNHSTTPQTSTTLKSVQSQDNVSSYEQSEGLPPESVTLISPHDNLSAAETSGNNRNEAEQHSHISSQPLHIPNTSHQPLHPPTTSRDQQSTNIKYTLGRFLLMRSKSGRSRSNVALRQKVLREQCNKTTAVSPPNSPCTELKQAYSHSLVDLPVSPEPQPKTTFPTTFNTPRAKSVSGNLSSPKSSPRRFPTTETNNTSNNDAWAVFDESFKSTTKQSSDSNVLDSVTSWSTPPTAKRNLFDEHRIEKDKSWDKDDGIEGLLDFAPSSLKTPAKSEGRQDLDDLLSITIDDQRAITPNSEYMTPESSPTNPEADREVQIRVSEETGDKEADKEEGEAEDTGGRRKRLPSLIEFSPVRPLNQEAATADPLSSTQRSEDDVKSSDQEIYLSPSAESDSGVGIERPSPPSLALSNDIDVEDSKLLSPLSVGSKTSSDLDSSENLLSSDKTNGLLPIIKPTLAATSTPTSTATSTPEPITPNLAKPASTEKVEFSAHTEETVENNREDMIYPIAIAIIETASAVFKANDECMSKVEGELIMSLPCDAAAELSTSKLPPALKIRLTSTTTPTSFIVNRQIFSIKPPSIHDVLEVNMNLLQDFLRKRLEHIGNQQRINIPLLKYKSPCLKAELAPLIAYSYWTSSGEESVLLIDASVNKALADQHFYFPRITYSNTLSGAAPVLKSSPPAEIVNNRLKWERLDVGNEIVANPDILQATFDVNSGLVGTKTEIEFEVEGVVISGTDVILENSDCYSILTTVKKMKSDKYWTEPKIIDSNC